MLENRSMMEAGLQRCSPQLLDRKTVAGHCALRRTYVTALEMKHNIAKKRLSKLAHSPLLYPFPLVFCHHHLSLQMEKRLHADVSHQGPYKQDRPRVLHTTFPSISNLRLHRTEPNPHHHTRK